MALSCDLIDSVLNVDTQVWSHTSNSRGWPRHHVMVRMTDKKWLVVYNSQDPNNSPTDFTQVVLFERVGEELLAHGPVLVGDGVTGMGEDRNVGYGIVGISPTKALIVVATDEERSHYVFTVDVSGSTMTVSNKFYPEANGPPSFSGFMLGSRAGLAWPFSETRTHFPVGGYGDTSANRRAFIDHLSVGSLSDLSAPQLTSDITFGTTITSYLDPTTLHYLIFRSGAISMIGLVGGYAEPVSSIVPAFQPTNAFGEVTPQQVKEPRFRRLANGKIGVAALHEGLGAANRTLRYWQITTSGTTLASQSGVAALALSGTNAMALEWISDELLLVGMFNGGSSYDVRVVEVDPTSVTIVAEYPVDVAPVVGAGIRAGGGGYALAVAFGPLSGHLVKVSPFGTGGWQVGSVAW